MKVLILVHVLSAIVGIGPTYFGLLLLRQGQSLGTLRHNLALSETLSLFPKVGGTLAVLSGLALVVLGGYGPLTQLWLLGSLLLYVLIQVVIVGFAVPREKQLLGWVHDEAQANAVALPAVQQRLLGQLGGLHLLASGLGLLLFALMILKPR